MKNIMGKILPQADAHLCNCTGNQWSTFLSYLQANIYEFKS